MPGEKVILVGGFHEMIELCELCGLAIVGLIDKSRTGEYRGYPILGGDENAPEILRIHEGVPVLLSPDSPAVRKKLAAYYRKLGFSFRGAVSPQARISKSARLGRGAVIQSGVNVSADVHVGDFAKLNSCCNAMHDCSIGDYSTIAPNALLLGHVEIADGCYIGAHATLLPHLTVGREAVVGAGAVVTKSVPSGCVVIGNPARRHEKGPSTN